MAKKVSAKVNGRTINGQLDDTGEFVVVWLSNGPQLGLYSLSRFDNNALTSGSLANLFTPKESE